jgi:hypothetical protein
MPSGIGAASLVDAIAFTFISISYPWNNAKWFQEG